MKTALISLSHQLSALQAFEAKYQPGERSHVVHSLSPDGDPHVVFYAQENGGADKLWALSAFGATGWKTEYRSEGYQHVCKFVDGVKVTLYQAYRLEVAQVVPEEVSPGLLTGAEVTAGYTPEPTTTEAVERLTA